MEKKRRVWDKRTFCFLSDESPLALDFFPMQNIALNFAAHGFRQLGPKFDFSWVLVRGGYRLDVILEIAYELI